MTRSPETLAARQTKARHIECSLEEYHARREWSRSQAEVLLASPPLFEGTYITRVYPRKRTQPMDLGTVAHACLSNPGGIDEVVAVIPREALNEAGHRKGSAWLAWKAEHEHRIMMKPDELEPVRHMIRNVYAHPIAGKLLSNAMAHEFTILYRDPETGLELRARPDLLSNWRGDIIVNDFKTTRALTPREFADEVVKWGLHRQAAWYQEAVEAFGYVIADFIFICADKSPAHECRTYDLPPEALELGRKQIREIRRDLARRLETDDWTDPLGHGLHTVDLPRWAYEDKWRVA